MYIYIQYIEFNLKPSKCFKIMQFLSGLVSYTTNRIKIILRDCRRNFDWTVQFTTVPFKPFSIITETLETAKYILPLVKKSTLS